MGEGSETMIVEKMTHAHNACPRCKSMQLDWITKPELDGKTVFERLRCYNCGVKVVQVYKYEYTYAEWEDFEEE